MPGALHSGKTTSCGCHQRALQSAKQKRHGESKSKLYGVWLAMRRRCYNSHAKHYNLYGGRGITVCEEWRNKYEPFRDWAMSIGYCQGLTIDRIDVNGPYSPENCRLVDCVAQANNRRSNIVLTYNGQSHTLKEWSDIQNIPYKLMNARFHRGWSVERLLFTKDKQQQHHNRQTK